ncbi:MAG: hypothetical protein ICV87_05660 [Gemmatimonadetes bacterium]|nr:hypothetical protein [Gemmatimonadota bacterium]
MNITRSALLLALAAALSACDDPTGELQAPWTGVYHLRTLGGHPLPAPLLDDRGRVTSGVSAASLRLNEDGTYRWMQDGPGTTVDFDSAGSYTVLADTMVRLDSGRRVTGLGAVARSESCVRGLACVFVREGADAGPELRYRFFALETIDGVPLGQRCCDVVGGAVWLRGDSRYLREVTTLAPGHADEEGTFQVAGTSITLAQSNPSQWTNQAATRPLTGSQEGARLTLGRYGYGEQGLR